MDWLRLLAAVAWLGIFVNWPQLTFAVTLIIIGGLFIAFNAYVFWLTVVLRREASSTAPILGGIIAAAGIAILPVRDIWMWFWVPLILDWGGLPLFLTTWIEGRAKR